MSDHFLRIAIAQAVLLGYQILLYFGCELFQKKTHNVLRKVDDSIPFLPWTVIIYSLWFPLILVLPMMMAVSDPKIYGIYMMAAAADVLLSVICYVAYPTSFERPVPPDTWDGRLMKVVYWGSFRGVNCAPSLHCSSCYLILVCAILCTGMPPFVRVLSGAVAVGIVLSTMTTKQHALIDAVTAIPMAVVCWGLGYAFYPQWLVDWIQGAVH